MKPVSEMTDDEILMELTDGKGLTADMEGQAEIWAGKSLAERVGDACAATDRTAKAMAEATRDLLLTIAAEWGYSPREIGFREPGAPCYFDNSNCYVVTWESGPFEWGYHACNAIGDKAGKIAEPFYSFDVCFYPAED